MKSVLVSMSSVVWWNMEIMAAVVEPEGLKANYLFSVIITANRIVLNFLFHPDPALETALAVSCNGHSPTYLRTAESICLNIGAKVAENVDEFHFVDRYQEMVG